MAKKKLEVFVDVDNEKEFNYILNHNLNRLICAEIYCAFSGPCTALDHLFTRIKLDWSNGEIILLRVLADEIQSLKRFHNQSQPIYLFIMNKKIRKMFRGVDNIRFAEVAKEELRYFKQEKQGFISARRTYDIDEPSEEDIEWEKKRHSDTQRETDAAAVRVAKRQAARKQHRAELMVPHLQHLNFVVYWPHATHGHPELYERWDMNNIIMVAREEVQLTKEMAEDVLYAGDAPKNEASMHILLSAPALAICFRLLDTDKHFVSLVRRILYEELPPLDDSKPLKEQLPQKTAFDLYKSFSPSREEVWQKRREEHILKKEQEVERRARRLSELQRLARQAIVDQLEARKAEKEQRKLEFLKAGLKIRYKEVVRKECSQCKGIFYIDSYGQFKGITKNLLNRGSRYIENLDALEKLRNEPDNFETNIIVPEELSDVEDDVSLIEDENEYLPPAGLLVPGFYSPPNDIAKANGLAVLFPKIVTENVIPEEEFLPPHVLVMLEMIKSRKAIKALAKYKDLILHMGVFKATTPYDSKHITYSVKQFEKDNPPYPVEDLRLVFMVSMERDLAVLELMDLNPVHVSRDCNVGEEECAAMFPVDYGDQYPEFEDFDETD